MADITDEQIAELRSRHGVTSNGRGVKEFTQVADFARAVLALQPSASVEPVADPMDWPLPCDVTVGHGTMRKGVKLSTLVLRMKTLYEMATGQNADEVASRTPEQRRALFKASPLGKLTAAREQEASATGAESTPPTGVEGAPAKQVIAREDRLAKFHDGRKAPQHAGDCFGITILKRQGHGDLISLFAEDDEFWHFVTAFDVHWVPELIRLLSLAAQPVAGHQGGDSNG